MTEINKVWSFPNRTDTWWTRLRVWIEDLRLALAARLVGRLTLVANVRFEIIDEQLIIDAKADNVKFVAVHFPHPVVLKAGGKTCLWTDEVEPTAKPTGVE